VLIEYVFADELAHAWSTPDSEGIFTDTAGPDATRIAWRFAELHDNRWRPSAAVLQNRTNSHP